MAVRCQRRFRFTLLGAFVATLVAAGVMGVVRTIDFEGARELVIGFPRFVTLCAGGALLFIAGHAAFWYGRLRLAITLILFGIFTFWAATFAIEIDFWSDFRVPG